MRLINADKFKSWLDGRIVAYPEESYRKDEIKKFIDCQPTASGGDTSKLERALRRAAGYIECDCGCCPGNYDYSLRRDKCKQCTGEIMGSMDKRHNHDLAVDCWREVFECQELLKLKGGDGDEAN